ncbi:hypothetical protein Ahy_A09g044539 [Arachis hypogaea]|uniref:SWIM-type domain-containing protein n=1 Tax=Arachis hypogaea TaxID=3818 RepID=A0A445BKB1_ARAHY|nr:hypothetical protein Ahy_A09g044539 [Arachis hypogaea]
MSHVVWNSFTKEAFDRNWNDFPKKYGIGDNKWLSVYLDHHFWAGMGSTQRSESMHDFLTSLLHITAYLSNLSNSMIIAKEVESRENERERIRCCRFSYHHTVCNKILNISSISAHSVLGYTVYEVVEQISNSTFIKFTVTYDGISVEVKCQCLLFESRGILCRHSLSTLSFE